MRLPKKIAAIDTETTGLNPYRKDVHAIVNTYWDNKGRNAVYKIPEEDPILVREALQDRETLKLFWNAGFDIPILQKQGLRIAGPVIDCLFMAEMAHAEERKKGLKPFSRKFLNDTYPEEIKLRKFVKDNKINVRRNGYGAVPDHLLLPYAIKDARNTYALFGHLRKRFDEHNLWPHLKLEMLLLSRMVLPMQSRGILVDKDRASTLLYEGQKEIKTIICELRKIVGEKEFNPNSPIQVAACIYNDKTGVEPTRYTNTGNPSTNELALLELSTRKEVKDLCLNMIKYRKTSKAVKTYLLNLKDAVDENGIFRVSFNQTRARTGRFSSSGYDIKGQLQNIPRSTQPGVTGKIREIFIARPGYRLVCIDLDQVEMRIQAHFLENEEMIDAIQRGDDLHNLACRRYLRKEPTPVYRYAAKTLNYAGTYGAGASKFKDTVYKESDGRVSISYELAARAIENYREGTAPLTEMVLDQVSSSGGVLDFYGRWIPVDDNLVYAGNNYIIQGTAAGYLKRKMLVVADILKGRRTKTLIQAHDELVFEVHQSEKKLVPRLQRAMEDPDQFLVPITASVSWGKSWGRKKPLKFTA